MVQTALVIRKTVTLRLALPNGYGDILHGEDGRMSLWRLMGIGHTKHSLDCLFQYS